MRLVELKDVSVEYDGHRVLSQVNLEIESDDFLGIIGPNGGGKSTLVKTIMGMLPYRGEILYSDSLRHRSGKPLIGYMPQQSKFDATFPISIREIVLSGLQAHKGFWGRYGSRDKRLAEELIQMAGIASVADHAAGEVSGGEMQRALLCRSIISEPKMLILDEPTNFVDNRFENELYTLLRELNRRMAVVMVSHDIGTISSVVKEIVCVNRTVHRHHSNIITEEQLLNYNCPIQIISHGHVPHTILGHHGDGDCHCHHN